MSATQAHRNIQVKSPLGQDKLLFYRMNGREGLGQLFEYEVEFLSHDYSIKPADIIGQTITISFFAARDKQFDHRRYFNGHVSRFGFFGTVDDFAYYRATVHPWLWMLTRNFDCRIFQKKSVPDIVKQICQERGFTDLRESLSEYYPPREYCVQYRESDFNFISRLMEHEGIYYFFEHSENSHVMVMADSRSAHKPVHGYEKIKYFDSANTGQREEEHIFAWSMEQEVRTGTYAMTDYDFKNPRTDLSANSKVERSHRHASYECFDYPGRYGDGAEGEAYARCRIEELHAQFERVNAKGNASGLKTGALFTLEGGIHAAQNREYLITGTAIRLQSNDYFTGSGSGGADYECSLTAIDSKTPYRSPRSTPRPVVQGPQTAVVVGKAGEEIWTNEHGQVKVHFHWDRWGQKDENSSCWVRVSHPWAGKGWGAVSIPRIGQEVVVDFLEGDPDQPIITGRVYNGDLQAPFALPASAVVSGIKSNTHKGKGYNELSMDDTAGKEKITIHGQYDMNTTVEHDKSSTIMNHRSTTVQNGNDTLTVATGTRAVTVKGNSTHVVQAGSRMVQVTGGDYLAQSTTASANLIGKTQVVITGETSGVFVSGTGQGVGIVGTPLVSVEGKDDVAVSSGTSVGINSPLVDIGDKTIQIHGNEITLSCGGSTIQMDGTKIVLSSGSGELTLDATGATLKGALVKIN